MLNFKEIISVSLILFSVIDILGNIPVIINLKRQAGKIYSGKATIIAGVIMILFLYLGENILELFGIDISSFAITGAIIMFIIGMEMVLDIQLFKTNEESMKTASIVPVAFPLIAGPGTMTSLISLRSEYELPNILVGIVINLILIYIVLKSSNWLERKMGKTGLNIVRKVFGIILLSIAIKLFKTTILL